MNHQWPFDSSGPTDEATTQLKLKLCPASAVGHKARSFSRWSEINAASESHRGALGVWRGKEKCSRDGGMRRKNTNPAGSQRGCSSSLLKANMSMRKWATRF